MGETEFNEFNWGEPERAMVNDYVLCHQIVTITVIRMKSGLDVPLSFLISMLRSFEVFEISDNKVIGA